MEHDALRTDEFLVGDAVTSEFDLVTIAELRTVDNGHTVRQVMSGTKPTGESVKWDIVLGNHKVPDYTPPSYLVSRGQGL